MRKRRGGVFILTLVVLAASTAILVGAVATQRVTFRAQLNRMESRKARVAAHTGLHYALGTLQDQDPGVVSQADAWYTLGNVGDDEYQVGDSYFRIQLLDASSFISLNTAPLEQLQRMPLTTEQIDSLLDWREPELQPRPEGAKDEFYNNLSQPYNTKLARLHTLDELLMVKGFAAYSLYEPPDEGQVSQTFVRQDGSEPATLYEFVTVDSFSPNLTPDGQPKANINTVQQQALTEAGLSQQLAQAIIQRRGQATFTRIGDVLAVPGMNPDAAAIVLDNFAIGEEARVEGKLNLNTATEQVLNSLPEMTPDVAADIVSRQSTGLATLGEVATIPGMTMEALQQLADFFTITSDTWIVRVIGRYAQTEFTLEAVVTLQNGVPKIEKTLIPPFNDMTLHWAWAAEAAGQVQLGNTR